MNQVVAQIKSLARKKNKIRLVRQVTAQFMILSLGCEFLKMYLRFEERSKFHDINIGIRFLSEKYSTGCSLDHKISTDEAKRFN